jgi:tetratricopeptide (TPR) repeat protein
VGGKTTLFAPAVLVALAAFLALHCRTARADEITEYQFALNAYDTGDYKAAIERFNKLLARDPQITNTALLVEIHKYLGASYMFTGQADEARKQFRELLKLEPKYELDSVLFPMEVLDEFLKVKKEMENELKQIEASKKKKLQELEQKRKKLKENWNKVMQGVKHPTYVRQNVKKNRLLLAFIPFGVGQFQNGHPVKGWLFFSFETALLASTVITFTLTDYYFSRIENDNDSQYLSRAEQLQHATTVTFWLFIGAIVAGIVDALVFFRWKKVTYETVKEEDIPPEYRLKPFDIPDLDLDEIIEDKGKHEKP